MSVFTPFSKSELIPKEERLEVGKKGGQICIGIPKEEEFQEKRIAFTPDAIAVLVSNGYEVKIEMGAGKGSNFEDNDYSEVGAKIVSKKEAFSQPVVVKINPPTLKEISHLTTGSYLFSALQINTRNKEYFEKLSTKKVTALAFEYLRDGHDSLALVRLISELAGITSILVAGEILSNPEYGKGLLLGGISGVRPTEVVIIGAGTVGENAARAARGLGASIRIFDNSLTRLRRIQEILGERLITSTLDPKELSKALIRCDVAIGCLRGEMRCPTVVSETMVSRMKTGSVIIDVSIDNGRVFETSEITSHQKPIINKYGIIHYGVPNITSKIARTASKAISNFFLEYFLNISFDGGMEAFFSKNIGVRKGIYMYKGRITLLPVSKWFDLPFYDINLLII